MKDLTNVNSRSWGFILPADWPNVDSILQLARELSVKHYYILHDSDFDLETGELKKAHYHVIMSFKTPRNLKTISNYFSDYQQFKPNSFERIRNITGAKRYLIHLDDGNKHRYGVEEVVTNDKNLADQLVDNTSNLEKTEMLFEAYENPPATFREFYEIHRPLFANANGYQIHMMMDKMNYTYERLRRNGRTAPPTPAQPIARGEVGAD